MQQSTTQQEKGFPFDAFCLWEGFYTFLVQCIFIIKSKMYDGKNSNILWKASSCKIDKTSVSFLFAFILLCKKKLSTFLAITTQNYPISTTSLDIYYILLGGIFVLDIASHTYVRLFSFQQNNTKRTLSISPIL